MVFPTRLKRNLLIRPAHGPIHTPLEFCNPFISEVKCVLKTAVAFVRNVITARIRYFFNSIQATLLTEYTNRQPLWRQWLLTILVQDFNDLLPIFQGFLNFVRVLARAVLLRLIQIFRIDAENRHMLFNLDLIMTRVALFHAIWIRNINNCFPQMLLEHLLIRHVRRDFSKHVIIIPAVNESYFLPRTLQRVTQRPRD